MSNSLNSLPVEFEEVSTICKATEVVIGGRTVIGIADAGDLHEGLGVGRDCSTWINDRIAKYGFVEGKDFETAKGLSTPVSGSAKSRQQPTKTYRLTLDMAKELAMVENNERGRLIRRYFIWAEDIAQRAVSGDLSQDDRAAIGGISKAVINKAITALRSEILGDFATLKAEITAVVEGFDQTQGIVTNYRPMLDVLKEEGVAPKARRSLSQRCSSKIHRWCAATQRDRAIRISRETGRYLFHVEAIRDWLAAEGRMIIVAHKDKIAGQGVLRLIPNRQD